MRVTITTLDAVVYQFAGSTIADDAKGIYRGRLSNQLNLARSFSELGSNLVTLQLQLINHDKIIPDNISLWGASVTVEAECGQQWAGKITAYESNADGKLIVTATERTAPELTQYLPDEFINLTTVTADMHSSSLKATIPLIIGGNATSPIAVKGILKSKTNGIYYLCVGEIHEIVKVRVGDKTLTRVEAEAAGYMTYTGSAAQASEPGIAYIHITDPDLRKNDDGSYVEIGAEVIGLKLGSHTVEECRNGARFLLWLLKTARTGVLGWGLGIAESDIDLATFATAITDVDTAGLKLDGTIYDRKAAQSWITEICRCIRGTYEIGENGKRRLYISKASDTSSYTYTKNNIELIRFGVGAYTGRVYNQGRLDYGYNPITGLFMQSAHFQDAASIAEIEEQEFEGSSYLVRDPATAQKILEYTCKRSLIGASKVLFSSRFLPANCRPGQLITLEYPEHSLIGLWKITSLQIGDHVHRIEAEKFNTSIFDVGTPGAAVSWSGDAPIVSTVLPGAASGLSLATDVEYDANGDGSAIPYISGTFTISEGKYLGAAVFWGEGAEPSAWNSVAIKGTEFKIKPLRAGQQYTVKVQMFNQSGTSAAITGSIVAGSHAAIPPTPTISTVPGLGCIVVNIATSAFAALSHFQIQRQKSDGSGLKTVAGEYRGTSFTDDDAAILADYANLYQYRVRSVSRSGQTSAWTSFTTAISATQLRNKDVSADQFIGKHFTTACNVGTAQNGVMFNAQGLQAWCNGVKTVDIPVSGSPTFSGTITATAGNIGGFTIHPTDGLYAGNGATRVQMKAGAGIWLGATAQNDAPFSVTQAGALKATSGVIGGWNITAGAISTVDAPECGWISIGCWFPAYAPGYSGSIFVGNGAEFACGVISIGRCLGLASGFSNLYSGISITGKGGVQLFRATADRATGSNFCGLLAGWNFNASQIFSTGCGLILCNTGAIQTGDFVTSNKGWKIDSVGNAEFNNICARGAIRTAVFIKDQISVVGGCAMIRPAGVSVYDCNPAADTISIYVNNELNQFAINDIIRIKDGISDYWGCITACGCNASGCYITTAIKSGARFNFTKGQAVVNYGSGVNGAGGIILNGQCPYIDIYTHAGLPWNGTESRVRIGNLKGWGSFATNTYGIAAGCPTGQYMTYDSASGVLDIAGNINVKSTLPLVMPVGAVGSWSVKGASTTSIRQTGGIIDVSGNNLNGTGSSLTSITDMVGVGKAVLFAGSGSSYATFPHNTLLDFERTDKFSISIVVRRDGNPTASSKFFTKGNGYYYAGYGIVDQYNENQFRFYLSAGATYLIRDLNYPTGYTSGTPITITMTYDGTTSYAGLKIYINGELASPDNVANNLTTSIKTTNNVIIGDYFNGAIALPKVFNRELSAEEVKTLYLLGKDTESGTITAERIKTGVMSSLNWGSSAGSCFNMNDGTFTLGGSSAPKLKWDGATLSVNGCVTSCSGMIGGWEITDTSLMSISSSSGVVMDSDVPRIGTFALGGGGSIASHGRMGWNDADQNAFGFSVTNGLTGPLVAGMGFASLGSVTLPSSTVVACGQPFFYVGTGATSYMQHYNSLLTVKGTVCSNCGNIGGWNFNAACLYKDNLIINSAGSISGCYNGDVSGWCIDAAGNAKFNNATVRGTVCASAGNVGGWTLNANCLYSGALVMNSAGSITGNYTAGSAGWCISCTGAAEFNCVTVRGALYSCCGKIGLWSLCDTGLYYQWSLGGKCGTSNVLANGFYFHQTSTTIGGKACLNVLQCCTNCNYTGAILYIESYSTSQYAFWANGKIAANLVCCLSDRNFKTDIQPVTVLPMIRQTPITKWRFCDSQDYNIGWMAQDFHRVFRLAHDWQTNTMVGGLDGIALRGIQELDECIAYNNRRIVELESRNACLETRLNCFESELTRLKLAA